MKKFFNKKNRVLIILVILFILVLTLKINNSQKENLVSPTPPPATPIPTKIQTEGQGTPDFYEKVRPEIINNYPLFDYIPYKTDQFTIDYLDPLVLEVTLKIDTQKIRQEVLDWISSKEIDPSTHKIIWKVK